MPYPAPTGPSDAVPKPFKTGQDKSYPTGRIITKLTDSTGGTASNTIADQTGTYTESLANNALASLAGKVNEIIDALASAGFVTRNTDVV